MMKKSNQQKETGKYLLIGRSSNWTESEGESSKYK